jgi:hypothetical protein
MQHAAKLICLLAILIGTTECRGHGFPIFINVAGTGQPLVVSGGLTDDGYATMYFDHHPDAFLDVFGPGVLGTDLPGFQINGMTPGSQLFLEAIPRPDYTDVLRPVRWLWHWSVDSGGIEEEPNNPILEVVDNNDVNRMLLTQFVAPTLGASVKVAEPTGGQIGNHLHALNYLLHATDPQEGVYGFFARVTSPAYGPSQPFLLALNHGLDHGSFLLGASASNDAAGRPGDYDLDGEVAGEDFLLWQRTFGSSQLAADGSLNGQVDAADLQVWNANYGRVAEVAAFGTQSVPEPTSLALAMVALSSCCRFCGCGSSARRHR